MKERYNNFERTLFGRTAYPEIIVLYGLEKLFRRKKIIVVVKNESELHFLHRIALG